MSIFHRRGAKGEVGKMVPIFHQVSAKVSGESERS